MAVKSLLSPLMGRAGLRVWCVGVAAVVDARRDGRDVLAVIAGSAVNQDGVFERACRTVGPAQQAVISQALANAGL